MLRSGDREEGAGGVTELEQRGAARLKARLGQFVIHSPLDVGLILAVVGLAALFSWSQTTAILSIGSTTAGRIFY